jgi:SSS family solute:Na+ symporter
MESVLLLGILLGYLAILIGIGVYSNRRVNSSTGFYLAERKVKLGALTATLSATVIGGSATIATAALIYRVGLPGLWLDIGGAIGLIVLGGTLAGLVRKTGLITLPEITGKFFDTKTRSAAALLIVLTQIAWVALLIQATGAILSVISDVNYDILLIGITAVFIIYTLLGGQFAVIYTDIIQFLVMLVGVCGIAVPLLLMKILPSFSTIQAEILTFPVNASVPVLSAASFFIIMFFPHLVGPDIYSKILSAKDMKTAKRGALLAGIFKFIFAGAIGILAIAAIVLFPNLENAALALPMAILELSPLIAGVVLAAFVSVMLSSADSVLLSSGTILSVDLFKKNSIKITRIGIICFGVLALLLSLYLQNIIDTLRLAYTVFTAGLTLPILFGFYQDKTKVTSIGAFVSLVIGGCVALLWLWLGSPYVDAVFIGLFCSLIPLLILRDNKKKKYLDL